MNNSTIGKDKPSLNSLSTKAGEGHNSLWGIIVGTMFLTEVPTGLVADKLSRKRSVNIALGLQLVGEIIFIFAKG